MRMQGATSASSALRTSRAALSAIVLEIEIVREIAVADAGPLPPPLPPDPFSCFARWRLHFQQEIFDELGI